MATQKKTATKKPAAKAKAPAKSVKKATPAKKKTAAPAKKTVAKKATVKKATPAKKSTPVKKAAPAKKVVAKKNVTTVKKGAAKKADIKKGQTVKKATDKKATKGKAAPAKKAVEKKAVPAKKAAVAKPAASTKKAAPAKVAPPAKKAAPAPKAAAKKEAPKATAAAKPVAAPAKPASKADSKKITKKLTTFAQTPAPGRASSGGNKTPLPSPRVAEEKKPTVVVARRVLDNKSKKGNDGKTMVSYQPEYNRSILDEPEAVQGPVYRYSDEELNEFKELITGRLEAARKELVYLQGLIMRKDEAGTEDTENRYMNMEDGSGAMEREQLAQLASRQIQFINHLEKALIRIENKTYGICRVTGKLIDKARLRAVPHATLSIEAKKTMSKQQ